MPNNQTLSDHHNGRADHHNGRDERLSACCTQPICIKLFEHADAVGAELRLVGGAVRNAFAGWPQKSPPDLDFAVDRPIEEFSCSLREAGFSVYDTGLSHGTVTVRADGASAEITQLRVDDETDGRHADIRFTTDWQHDAHRRDFTINALYLDGQGQLYDPVGGRDDLKACRLRFIGEPSQRLAEDYLRLLRAFRFLSVYPELEMTEADYHALAEAVRYLSRLSSERIGSEYRQICSGAAAAKVVAQMSELDVDRQLFGAVMCYPFAAQHPYYTELCSVFAKCEFPEQLALCLPATADLARLSLSRKELRMLTKMKSDYHGEVAAGFEGVSWQRSAYRMYDIRRYAYLSAVADDIIRFCPDRLRQIVYFEAPSCPVSGLDIQHSYNVSGADIAARLAVVRDRWIDSDFTLTKDDLLR